MTKTAWITGATSGFGRAAAKRFVEGGWQVIASGRRAERLDALRDELGAEHVHVAAFDIRDADAMNAAIAGLPEGFLATSDELAGLVAQGRTVAETLDIARDVARKLIEARREREGIPNLPTTSERRDYTIVVAA